VEIVYSGFLRFIIHINKLPLWSI